MFWAVISILGLLVILFVSISSLKPKQKRPPRKRTDKLRVAFLHPDLGIGGAENLVVNAAVGLVKNGHKVKIFTSFHPEKSFTETKDGTLEVEEVGNWLPHHTKGKCQLLKAWLRFFWVSFVFLKDNKENLYDIIFVDQISATIPFLKLSGSKIFFYCHFPDQLLSTKAGILKSLYRMPIDFIEEHTTNSAHQIVVNSKFTRQIFRDTFPSIKRVPQILYPAVDVHKTPSPKNLKTPTFVSLNRYERKKNIELAIHAFKLVKERVPHRPIQLVIAGGYNPLLAENVEYHAELVGLASKLHLTKDDIQFKCSIDDNERDRLLSSAICLLYTPPNEHFGIVPLEAAVMMTPVIACNSGGPLESIQHGETGYLVPPEPGDWAQHMQWVLEAKEPRMGELGQKRVVAEFSLEGLANNLEEMLFSLVLEKNTE